MRICVVILVGLTVAVYAQDTNSGIEADSRDTEASLPSSEEYNDVGDSGSAACSSAAQLDKSASGSPGDDGQDASASDDASLNANPASCDRLRDASVPDVPSGYVYTIGLHRFSLFYSDNDVVYTNNVDGNSQPVTYYETVDVDHPFMIHGWLWNLTDNMLAISSRQPINACLEYEEGTWEKFAVDIVLTQLSPTGSCPINPGTYNIYKDFQEIETFDEMMSCNNYTALLYAVNSKGQTAVELAYTFNVDEGQCAPDSRIEILFRRQ